MKITGETVMFDIMFEIFHLEGLTEIKKNFPNTTIITRADFLVPLLTQFPEYVENILKKLDSFGLNEFSISFNTYKKENFIEALEVLGYDLNLRDIYTLDEFLQAILYLPSSLISTFDFDVRIDA
ncbi:MAG: hypothetical protein IH840_04020 [Candidatus Heimdallarchaeota archaeon]|nr:hypothetical protein [Candidatus Heimdallarchaeota archaeon]